MIGLAKIAASFDARRNKQYWQLLKRMYGGADDAVSAIKTSGDPHIYHGTFPEKIPGIEAEGLKVGERDYYGKGQYFGSKKVSDFYTRGFNTRVRFKAPSELAGTKELYPKVENAVTMDLTYLKPDRIKDELMDLAHLRKDELQHNIPRTRMGVKQQQDKWGDIPEWKKQLRSKKVGKVFDPIEDASSALKKQENELGWLNHKMELHMPDFGFIPPKSDRTMSPELRRYQTYGQGIEGVPKFHPDPVEGHSFLYRNQPTISPNLLKFPN